MSLLGGSVLGEDEIQPTQRHELLQSSVVSMYSLPDVTRSAACDTDRSRGWMMREGGARAAFLEAREAAPDSSSSLVSMWREHGLLSFLRQWIESNQGKGEAKKSKLASVLCKAVSMALSGFRFSSSLFSKRYPHHSLSAEQIIEEFSSCGPDYLRSKVRAIDWHPHTLKLAVASMDDALRVFYGGSESDKTLVPNLKHPRQKNISCIKWRPLSASGLAVAAQDGVVLWKVDPNSLSSRPASSCVTFLISSGHRPVTSLAWSTDGLTLFSASPCDNKIIAWDVTRNDGAHTPLVAITGGGISLLSLSPTGKLLLSATPSLEFRVWNSGGDWSNEKWTDLNGRLRTAAWSPDGATLLFATEGDCLIYAIDFKTNWETKNREGKNRGIETTGEARPVLDLSQLDVGDSDCDASMSGGGVHQLAWDPSGERLAVAFQPQSGHAGLVALFSTRIRSASSGASNLDFSPAGVIRGAGSGDGAGADEPYAAAIAFCPKFPPGSEPPWSPGALLAVAWAVSGRVSYQPLHFIPSVPSGSASILNSSLAASKLLQHSVVTPSSHNDSLLRNGVYANDTLSNHSLLDNYKANSSFHSFSANPSSQSQLFSVQS